MVIPNKGWSFGNESTADRQNSLSLALRIEFLSVATHHLVKWMSYLPVLSSDYEHNTIDTILDQVLTPTDIKIIEATAQVTLRTGKPPSASEILKELSKTNSLKKTQLYERLNRLTRIGFITVKILPRPRKYIANRNTITEGVEKWIEEQMASIASLSSELESMRRLIKQTKPGAIVSAIAQKLTLDITSNI